MPVASAKNVVSGKMLALVGVLAMAAYGPLLADYFRGLWQREHYQYFPVVIILGLLIGLRRWREAEVRPQGCPQCLVFVLTGVSCGMLALGVLTQSSALAMLSAIMGVGALIVVACSKRAICNALGLWLLLWLLVRLPFKLDLRLITAFQTLTTDVSSLLLDTMGILHLTDGHVLSFEGKDFFIDEACSGIMSLMALLAASVVMVVLRNRPLVHGGLLVVSALFWAGLMNTVRILTVSILYVKFGWDMSSGWKHDILGVGTFLVAVLGVVSTDCLLAFLLRSIPRRRRVRGGWLRLWNSITTWGDPVRSGKTGYVYWDSPRGLSAAFLPTLVGAFVMLIGLQVTVHAFRSSNESSQSSRRQVSHVHQGLEADSIVPTNPDWKLMRFAPVQRENGSSWGENSLIWTYQDGEFIVRMAIDFPFFEHHDLGECYENRGWDLMRREILGTAENLPEGVVYELDLQRPATSEYGYCLSGAMTASGEWAAQPQASLLGNFKARFLGANVMRGEERVPMYQIQVFVISSHRLGASQRADLRDEIGHFQQELGKHFQRIWSVEG